MGKLKPGFMKHAAELKRLSPPEVKEDILFWSCKYCTKRNSTRLRRPVAPVEIYNCKFCYKPSSFSLEQKS